MCEVWGSLGACAAAGGWLCVRCGAAWALAPLPVGVGGGERAVEVSFRRGAVVMGGVELCRVALRGLVEEQCRYGWVEMGGRGLCCA